MQHTAASYYILRLIALSTQKASHTEVFSSIEPHSIHFKHMEHLSMHAYQGNDNE